MFETRGVHLLAILLPLLAERSAYALLRTVSTVMMGAREVTIK